MPWKPPPEDRPPYDERVETCRDRAAHLVHEDGRSAMLYCRVDTEWMSLGGHLWWRRWSAPRYRLEEHWFEGGVWSDFVSSGEVLARTLDDFDRGMYLLAGEPWRVQWLDEEGSRAFREEHGFEIYDR